MAVVSRRGSQPGVHAVQYQPNSESPKNACMGRLMVIYKEKLCYATARG